MAATSGRFGASDDVFRSACSTPPGCRDQRDTLGGSARRLHRNGRTAPEDFPLRSATRWPETRCGYLGAQPEEAPSLEGSLHVRSEPSDQPGVAGQSSRRRVEARSSAPSFMVPHGVGQAPTGGPGSTPRPRGGVGAAIAARAFAGTAAGSWRAAAGTCTSAGTSTTVVSTVRSRTPRTRASTEARMRTPSFRRRRGSGATVIAGVARLSVREAPSAELLESL